MLKIMQVVYLLFLISCSGIKTLNSVDRNKLYGADFLDRVREVNYLLNQKNLDEVEVVLKEIDENELSSNECPTPAPSQNSNPASAGLMDMASIRN